MQDKVENPAHKSKSDVVSWGVCFAIVVLSLSQYLAKRHMEEKFEDLKGYYERSRAHDKKEYELDRAHDREQDKLDRDLYNEINAQFRADIKELQEQVKKLKAK